MPESTRGREVEIGENEKNDRPWRKRLLLVALLAASVLLLFTNPLAIPFWRNAAVEVQTSFNDFVDANVPRTVETPPLGPAPDDQKLEPASKKSAKKTFDPQVQQKESTLTVSKRTSKIGDNRFTCKGRITNFGEKTSVNIKVKADLFDLSDKPLASKTLSFGRLEPGESRSYSITFVIDTSVVGRYLITTSGEDSD